MRRFIHQRFGSAHVIALLALFVALGGTGYAAVSLPKGSVGPAQIRASAVSGKKIRAGAIDSTRVRDGSLRARDFRAGQLPAGPKGDQGPKGDPGTPGTARAFGTVAVDGSLLPGSKNLTSTRASTGRYCVQPDPSLGIDVSKTMPVVGNADSTPMAPAVVHGSGLCPTGWLVSTIQLEGASTASLVLEDTSFAIVVP